MARTIYRKHQERLSTALRQNRITLRKAAELCNVPYHHFEGVVAGRIRPRPEVVERLPIILETPLTELLDHDRIPGYYFAQERLRAAGVSA